jgi:hypothetical protein
MEIDIHQLDHPHARLRLRDSRQEAIWLAPLSQGDPGGSLGTMLVLAAKAPERFLLIDGYARAAALGQLARDTVEVIVLPLCEADAPVFTLRLATQASQVCSILKLSAVSAERRVPHLGRGRCVR